MMHSRVVAAAFGAALWRRIRPRAFSVSLGFTVRQITDTGLAAQRTASGTRFFKNTVLD
jgi:hypothetical protein